jgi:aryl-alcohol dehydrogenase-like predicted oxidoreductase
VVEQLVALAERAGLRLRDLAMVFAVSHPGVMSAIIHPDSIDQLEDLPAGAEVTADDDRLDHID